MFSTREPEAYCSFGFGMADNAKSMTYVGVARLPFH